MATSSLFPGGDPHSPPPQLVQSDGSFAAILAQGSAHDMFDDWIDTLEEAFRRDYKRIKLALERRGYTLRPGDRGSASTTRI